MTTQLSPAAQAVWNAANNSSAYGPEDCLNEARQIAAAALRAVADQVVPAVPLNLNARGTRYWHRAIRDGETRLQFLAIADELEGAGFESIR